MPSIVTGKSKQPDNPGARLYVLVVDLATRENWRQGRILSLQCPRFCDTALEDGREAKAMKYLDPKFFSAAHVNIWAGCRRNHARKVEHQTASPYLVSAT